MHTAILDNPFEALGEMLADEPQILQALSLAAPDRAPDPADSERVVWMKAGAAHLVRDILAAVERAQAEHRAGTHSVRI